MTGPSAPGSPSSGPAAWVRLAARWGYLASFYVRPSHRSTGLGGRMLAALTAYADAEGFVRVVLSPTERSVPLYARAGFVPATCRRRR